MPKERMPTRDKKLSGIFEGEYFGNLWLTKNIDLGRNVGKIVLGESLSSVFDSVNDTDLTTPVAFLRTAADSTDRWWAMGGKLFKTTNTATAPVYDMVEFVDDMYVAIAADVSRLVAGTWTAAWWSNLSSASALQSGVPHRFDEFAGALLITDG